MRHMTRQPDRITVRLAERHPAEPPASHGRPLAQHGRLAVSPRRREQNERHIIPDHRQALKQPCPRDRTTAMEQRRDPRNGRGRHPRRNVQGHASALGLERRARKSTAGVSGSNNRLPLQLPTANPPIRSEDQDCTARGRGQARAALVPARRSGERRLINQLRGRRCPCGSEVLRARDDRSCKGADVPAPASGGQRSSLVVEPSQGRQDDSPPRKTAHMGVASPLRSAPDPDGRQRQSARDQGVFLVRILAARGHHGREQVRRPRL